MGRCNRYFTWRIFPNKEDIIDDFVEVGIGKIIKI